MGLGLEDVTRPRSDSLTRIPKSTVDAATRTFRRS